MILNWQMWEGYFSKEICERIVETAKSITPLDAEVGFQGSTITQETRRSKIRWINRQNHDLRWLLEEMNYIVHASNRNAFDVDVTQLFELQFTEYSSEYQGHYDWHNDVNWDEPIATQRKLSVIVQLSDPKDYEGGDFEMQPLHLEPPLPEPLKKQGTVLVFPSFLQHKVHPVTSGIRHSIVGWMEGPKWR